MSFFEKTAGFDLYQHFDPSHPDVRIQIRDLFTRTHKAIAREKDISLEVVLLIGCLERRNAAVNLGLGKREILADKLGLTINQYWKRAQAGRMLTSYPEFIDLVREGKTHVSHVAMLAPAITEANKSLFLKEISGKSERQIQELKASIRRDGSRKASEAVFDIKIQLTKSELALLDRAREVLSSSGAMPTEGEALVRALGDLLARRDPMRKAERAERRRAKKQSATSVPKAPVENEPNCERDEPATSVPKAPVEKQSIKVQQSCASIPPMLSALKKMSPEKGCASVSSVKQFHADEAIQTRRTKIPAQIQHQVMLRDGGVCSFVDDHGVKCGVGVGTQYDHVIPVCHGGSHELPNVRLLCRRHNLSEADRLIGHKWMEQFRRQNFVATQTSTN